MRAAFVDTINLIKYSTILDNPYHTFDLQIESVLSNVKLRLVAVEKNDPSVIQDFPTFGVEILARLADRGELHGSEELFH